MTVIKALGVRSVAKITAVIAALVGLLLGVPLAAIAFMVGPAGFGQFGWLAFAAMPFIYGALGFVGGAVYAWLYNVVAGWVGGIQVDLVPEAGR